MSTARAQGQTKQRMSPPRWCHCSAAGRQRSPWSGRSGKCVRWPACRQRGRGLLCWARSSERRRARAGPQTAHHPRASPSPALCRPPGRLRLSHPRMHSGHKAATQCMAARAPGLGPCSRGWQAHLQVEHRVPVLLQHHDAAAGHQVDAVRARLAEQEELRARRRREWGGTGVGRSRVLRGAACVGHGPAERNAACRPSPATNRSAAERKRATCVLATPWCLVRPTWKSPRSKRRTRLARSLSLVSPTILQCCAGLPSAGSGGRILVMGMCGAARLAETWQGQMWSKGLTRQAQLQPCQQLLYLGQQLQAAGTAQVGPTWAEGRAQISTAGAHSLCKLGGPGCLLEATIKPGSCL